MPRFAAVALRTRLDLGRVGGRTRAPGGGAVAPVPVPFGGWAAGRGGLVGDAFGLGWGSLGRLRRRGRRRGDGLGGRGGGVSVGLPGGGAAASGGLPTPDAPSAAVWSASGAFVGNDLDGRFGLPGLGSRRGRGRRCRSRRRVDRAFVGRRLARRDRRVDFGLAAVDVGLDLLERLARRRSSRRDGGGGGSGRSVLDRRNVGREQIALPLRSCARGRVRRRLQRQVGLRRP